MATLKPDQSMEGAWIEAFRVGCWTDSAGNTANWTPEKIDAFLAKYNPAVHMAPLRIDHVEPQQRKGRGPAFGWIAAAKREGERVMVKLAQVQPQFEEWVKSGLVKFRSIAWDPSRGIHHLAFLGYNCPAVPGMENVYDDGDGVVTIQFEEKDMSSEKKPVYGRSPLQRLFAAFRDAFAGTDRKERSQFCGDCSDQVCIARCPTGAISMTPEKGAIIDPAKCTICYACSRACPMMRGPVEGMEVANYNQDQEENEMKLEEVSKLVTDSVTAALKPLNDQLSAFSEQNKELKAEVAGLRKQIGEGEESAARRELEAFCDSPEMRTRITPAARPAIVAHMLTLRSAEPVEFDDGKGNKTKKSQLEMYQEDLRKLPETVQLSEFATGGRVGERGKGKGAGEFSGQPVDEDRLELHNQVLAHQEAHPGTSYETALAAVMNKKGGN